MPKKLQMVVPARFSSTMADGVDDALGDEVVLSSVSDPVDVIVGLCGEDVEANGESFTNREEGFCYSWLVQREWIRKTIGGR